MKRILICFAAIITAVACQKEPKALLSQGVEMVFTATNADSQTKTSRQNDGKLLWSPQEEINVFHGSKSEGRFVSTNTEPADVADFKGTLNVSTAVKDDKTTSSYWAVYPYSEKNSFDNESVVLTLPCNQSSIEGSVSDGMFPSVAKSTSLSLPFYNVCGGMKISLSRQNIASITLEGNNGEPLAGKIKVTFDEGLPVATILDGETIITLTPAGSGTFIKGSDYYFTIVPVELPSGFKMTFRTTDGKRGVLATSSSAVIKRNVFATKANIDSYVTAWEDDPEPLTNRTGLYLGITGFNQGLFKLPMTFAAYNNQSTFDNFINSLTANNGTMLYYAVDHTLDVLQKASFPNELANVAVVTFTDGLDQGSIMHNPKYATDDEYLSAINNRLKNEKVSGVDITAYSIGLKGSDVKDVQKFQNSLKKLASCDENAFEATNMSQVEARFKEIAKIASAYPCYDLAFTIPGQASGTKIRFTLDDVSSATSSALYIEGTFNLATRSLESVRYEGMTASPETTIKGKVDGIFVTFEFKGLSKPDESEISLDYVKQWSCAPSSSTWQINSEFSKEDAAMSTSYKTAAVILILDCSSSLGSKFSSMQSCAHSFVSSLYDALGFEVKDISLDKTLLELNDPGESYNLMAKITPATAVNKSITWSSSNSSIATVDNDGLVTGVSVGTCTITAKSNNGISTSCSVSVTTTKVDLGLSVKWRTCNVGASKPEDYGRYFAFGDVYGQTWDGSSWSDDGFNAYPTYKLDNKDNLQPEYDTAHVLLGGSWRMPTKAEFQELINNCKCTWTSNYNSTGVAGRIFTSKKAGYTDKSIFLPAAGYGSSYLYDAGSYGFYWSSTFNVNNSAWYFFFGSDYVRTYDVSRSRGLSVRPVSD